MQVPPRPHHDVARSFSLLVALGVCASCADPGSEGQGGSSGADTDPSTTEASGSSPSAGPTGDGSVSGSEGEGPTGAEATDTGMADVMPPTVSIVSPGADAAVSGGIDVQLEAMDDVGVVRVELSVDGVVVGQTDGDTIAWDTTSSGDGPVLLVASAFDAADNRGDSEPVSVLVLNGDCTREQFLAAPFGGGTGAPDDPYLICSVPQLRAVAEATDAAYLLQADLDLGGEDWEGASFPIEGVFDGGDRVIANLTTTASPSLFGVVSGELRNLRVVGADVTNTGDGGGVGLVASTVSGLARNVHASGTARGDVVAGGIAAFCSGRIVECTAEVDATASYVGGLCGDSSGIEAIEDSHTSGTLQGTIAAGGLVSTVDFGPGPTLIARSSSSADVSGDGYVGGLVGLADGLNIEDSFSTGTLSTTSDGLPRVAGLAGYTGFGTVVRSYFAGSIDVQLAPGNVGSFVGGLVIGSPTAIESSFVAASIQTNGSSREAVGGDAGTLTDVFYDVSLTEGADCIGGGPDPGCTGVNADGSMSDYFFDPTNAPMTAWDFTPGTGVWADPGEDYPVLQSLRR